MAALSLGVNTYAYTYSHSAPAAMRHLAGMGYRAFEILVTPPHLWVPDLEPAARRDLPRELAARGLRIVSFNLPSLDHNLVSPTADMRRYTVGQLEALVDLAGEWGVPWVVVVPGRLSPLFPAPREWVMEWFATGLRRLAGHAGRAGVQLLVENVPHAWLPRAEVLARALDEVGDARLGVVYDVANAVYAGEDPRDGLARLRDRVRLVHLSDTGTDRWRHDPVGRGAVDFAAVGAALRAMGFAGPSMLEIISAEPDRDIPASHRALAEWGWEPPRATP